MNVKHYLPHIVFFGIFLVALLPVLYYYQRKNPNPRFRPRAGEMTLVLVICCAVAGPACYLLGNIYRNGDPGSDFSKKPDEGAGWSRGMSSSHNDDDDKGNKRGSEGGDEDK